MSRRRRIFVAKIISPIVIAILKVHTAITGTERSRIIIFNEYKEILMVRGVIGPKWTLPGGAIEKNESPIQAAVRELYEETGINVNERSVRSVGVLKGDESPVNYVAHVFFGTVSRAQLPTELHNKVEIIETGWFDLSDLPNDVSAIARACLKLLSK